MQLKETIEYTVRATIEDNTIKLQTISSDTAHIAEKFLNLQEEATRQALIKLGCAPPDTFRERRFVHNDCPDRRIGTTIVCDSPVKLSKTYDITSDMFMFRMSQYDLYVTTDYSMMVAIAEFVLDQRQEEGALTKYIVRK